MSENKKSDLIKKYLASLMICEDAGIDTMYAVKFDGRHDISLYLSATTEHYDFCIAVVEDKPVFVGDALYLCGIKVDATAARFALVSSAGDWSWNSPKPRMMTIGSVEFVAPSREPTDTHNYLWTYNGTGRYFVDQERAKFVNIALNAYTVKIMDGEL
jgi:hypothetical protein